MVSKFVEDFLLFTCDIPSKNFVSAKERMERTGKLANIMRYMHQVVLRCRSTFRIPSDSIYNTFVKLCEDWIRER